jgi:Uma2 family endonuclease
MATAAAPVPVEVYLTSSFEPDAEYVDGEIQERAAGELDHAAWQAAIQKWFWPREKEWGVRVFAELRAQVTPTRFRVPDVVVLENTGQLTEMEQVVRKAPAAVFEILSPEDTHAYSKSSRIMKQWAPAEFS